MNIALKLKRVFAAAATVALLASNAGVAIAQTFNDVPTDSWYYSYVEQLVDDGVFDAGDTFRPGDALNRAELVKIVITAIDGLAGYEAPATPTFDDVPADAWFYDYVEAAVQLDIVNGYTDAQGNLTGMFGPGDTVNRAAATKILVNAFGVETDLDPAGAFGDVSTSAWYYDYVTTAYNQSILDGYANGNFGPADPVTRAQVAKLVVNSQNPTPRTVPSEEEEEETPAPAPAGEGVLEVSLNDNAAPSGVVPGSATSVDLAAFDFTADQDDVVISSITVTRTGVGDTDDFTSVYVYEGATRLRSGKTISSDTNTVTFTGLSVNVPAGETVTLYIKGDVDSIAGNADANNQHRFALMSAADITTNGESIVGDFPVMGNTISIGSVDVATVTVAIAGSISSPVLGSSEAEVANFKLTAAGNDIAFHSIALTHSGTISRADLANFKLYQGSSLLAETAEIGDGDLLVFTLDTPFEVKKSQNRNFKIYADILGGKSTDNIKFYLDETGDITVIDQQYGYGSAITNNLGTGNVTAVSLQAGDLTIADNGPASADYAANSTNNEFFNFSMNAGRNLTIKDYDIIIEQTVSSAGVLHTGTEAAGGGDVTLTKNTETAALTLTDDGGIDLAAGDIIKFTNGIYARVTTYTNDTSFTVTPYNSGTINATSFTQVWDASTSGSNKLKELRLVDLDTGNTLYNLSTPTGYTLASDDFDINAGDTRHLSIQLDIDTSTAATNAYKAGVNFNGTSYVKDIDANEYLDTSNIVGGNIFGKVMTVNTNSLTLTQAANPDADTYVKGEAGAPMVGVSMKAGDAGDIKITRIKARLHADDDTTFDCDASANDLVETVSLYRGNDLVAGPKGMSEVGTVPGACATNYYRADFNNLNEVVTAGSTATYTVKVDLKGIISSTRYLAVEMDADNGDIEAEDMEGNTLTAGTNLTGDVNDAGGTTAHTVTTSGFLYVAEQDSPEASVVRGGETGVVMAKYKFTGKNESFTVKKLDVVLDTDNGFADVPETTNSDRVAGVKLMYTNSAGEEVTTSASTGIGANTGGYEFSGLDFFVPKDDDAFLTVMADLTSVDQAADSGKSIKLGFNEQPAQAQNNFEAIGTGSGDTLKIDSANLSVTAAGTLVNSHVVRKSVPTVAKATSGLSTSLTTGQKTVYGFKVSADADGSTVNWRQVKMRITGNMSNNADTVNNFKFYKGSTNKTDDVQIIIDATPADGGGAAGDNLEGTGTDIVDAGLTFDLVARVEWNDSVLSEESITAGSSATYYLKADVGGADTSGESVSIYIPDDTAAVGNTVTGVQTTRFKVITQSATADALVYDVKNDTTAVGSAVCANSSDDILLGIVGGVGTSIAVDVTDCDTVTAATTTLFKTLTDNGDANDSLVYDVSNDTAAGADGAPYNNTADDIWVFANGGALPADSDAVAPAAAVMGQFILTSDAGALDSMSYDVGNDTAAADNAVCANIVDDDVLSPAGAAAADCEAVLRTANSSIPANFLWSDNSVIPHSTLTQDWTNGFNVDDLETETHTISF